MAQNATSTDLDAAMQYAVEAQAQYAAGGILEEPGAAALAFCAGSVMMLIAGIRFTRGSLAYPRSEPLLTAS